MGQIKEFIKEGEINSDRRVSWVSGKKALKYLKVLSHQNWLLEADS